jgi:Protein of unknown function (DUF1203)
MNRAAADVSVMTTTTITGFRVEAIPGETLARMRAAAVDDFGNKLVATTSPQGGEPLRCCLREAAAGERVVLIAYRPFPWDGVYAEVGPVFVHADDCGGYTAAGAYPEGFRHRQQIFRSYGQYRTIVDARIVEGADAEAAITELLDRPDVDFVHSRNVAYDCYMFALHRR